MNIREATEKDSQSWSNLRSQLWPDESAEHEHEIKEYFAGRAHDIETCYLAEFEGKAVGFIELNVRDFAEGTRSPKVPYIEGWFVDPKHRNKGIGTALIEQAQNWALSLGYTELASDTETGNNTSILLHRKLGFKETYRIVCFLKKLKA